uniref:Uncharacterized protein n=1 Tax=Manihot esculenta TaxID=3983 RepID=A0A2C9WFL7_MANES
MVIFGLAMRRCMSLLCCVFFYFFRFLACSGWDFQTMVLLQISSSPADWIV